MLKGGLITIFGDYTVGVRIFEKVIDRLGLWEKYNFDHFPKMSQNDAISLPVADTTSKLRFRIWCPWICIRHGRGY
jgi:hypothetical protein